MLAETAHLESGSSVDARVLNFKTENKNPAIKNAVSIRKTNDLQSKYQCVVCQTNKVSLSELHWHQTYQHSTEELSLSVIGWKGLVKVITSQPSQEKENQKQSIYNSFSKKPSQFYYLSSSILGVQENKPNLEVPIDCSLPLTKVEDNLKIKKEIHDYAVQEDKDEVKICPVKITENKSNLEVPIDFSLLLTKVEDNFKIQKEIHDPVVEEDKAEVKICTIEITENKSNLEVPLDCSLSLKKVQDNLKELKEIHDHAVKKDKAQIKTCTVNITDIKVEQTKIECEPNMNEELNWAKEISMDEFQKGVTALCSELEYCKKERKKKSSRKRHYV